MTTDEKVSIIASIPTVKGIFGFEAVTEKIALKKSRVTKIPTPPHLAVIRVHTVATVWMGGDYQTMVNKVREKEGEVADFESQPTYCKPVSENRLVWEHQKTGQLYFRVYLGYGATMNCEFHAYDCNDRELTPEEYKRVSAEYLPLKYESNTQGTEQEILVRNYKIENVLRLKRGEEWLG